MLFPLKLSDVICRAKKKHNELNNRKNSNYPARPYLFYDLHEQFGIFKIRLIADLQGNRHWRNVKAQER